MHGEDRTLEPESGDGGIERGWREGRSFTRRSVMNGAGRLGIGAATLPIVGTANAVADTKQFKRTSEAPDWTSLFDTDSGWLGADGIYSIPLNGNDAQASADSQSETLFVFSDTLIEEGEPTDALQDFQIVNNTVALLHGDEADPDRIEFFWKTDALGQPESVFVPDLVDDTLEEYYWLGDGFVNHALDDTIYIFGLQFRPNREDPGGFPEHVATDLLAISSDSSPPFPDYRRIGTPLLVSADEEEGRGGERSARR